MHEVIRAMKERRSVRAYQPRQISEEELAQILEAGLYAPSGRGEQSVYLVAVQDPAVIARLSQLNAQVMGTKADPFYGEPLHLGGGRQPGPGEHDERGPCPGPGVLLDPPGPGGL